MLSLIILITWPSFMTLWVIVQKTYLQILGNKAKWRISKRVLQESKARQIFRKTNIPF